MNKDALRAVYDDNTITVYQAYNNDIARSASKLQRFTSPHFKRERMTWIKTSFLWMMYRSDWATKENQEHVLAIKIKREGFNWALRNSCLTSFNGSLYKTQEQWKNKITKSPVRIQWDPDRDMFLQKLPNRAIQVGLSGQAVDMYSNDWIISIDDITDACHQINNLIIQKRFDDAINMLPIEVVYNLPKDVLPNLGIIY